MRLHVFYQQPPETLWNKSDRWRWGRVIKHPIKNHIFFLERNVKVCRFKLFLLKITSRTTSKTCEANDIRPGSDHWTLPTEVKGHLSFVHTSGGDCVTSWPWCTVWKTRSLIAAMLIWIYRKRPPSSTSPRGRVLLQVWQKCASCEAGEAVYITSPAV